MTQEELNKQENEITKQMYQEIDKNYSELNLELVEPIFDDNGNIKNKKEVDEALKKAIVVISALWLVNWQIIEKHSRKTMIAVNEFTNTLKKKLSKTMISTKEWNDIMDKTIKDRTKKIKIKQVIQGNANLLNKRVQKTVQDMYRTGKSWPQTQKELQRQFNYSKAKAKSIAITEKNYYKSEAQLKGIDSISENVEKIWIHNKAKDPRESHLRANGKKADKDGYFHIGGLKTKAPQHFGIASQDINCHCTMRIEIKEG